MLFGEILCKFAWASNYSLYTSKCYIIRNRNNFHPPFLHTELSNSTIFYQGRVLWNELPVNLKKLKSPKQFNCNYKCQLLQS